MTPLGLVTSLFFLSSSIWSGTCNLALELETLSLVCKLQPHPGLSLPENLLQEKHSELSLGDKKGKLNIDMQSSEVQDSRNDILIYCPILRDNLLLVQNNFEIIVIL